MTQLTEQQVAEIADGLAPSVRAFVGGPFYSAIGLGIAAAWFCKTGYWAGRQAAKLGLGERHIVEPGLAALIPNELGLAVRAHLERQQ